MSSDGEKDEQDCCCLLHTKAALDNNFEEVPYGHGYYRSPLVIQHGGRRHEGILGSARCPGCPIHGGGY